MTVSISKCIFRCVPDSLCKDNVQDLTHFNSLKTQILRKLFGFQHEKFALENIPSDFIPACFLRIGHSYLRLKLLVMLVFKLSESTLAPNQPLYRTV